jgi:hypothetical protein
VEVMRQLADLGAERDRLIRELVRAGGHGAGARLARLTKLTTQRIHQIATGEG